MAKTPKKAAPSGGKIPEAKESKQSPAGGGERKINPWIPIAVVSFIVALIAVMAAMSNSTSNTPANNAATAASGTTQSGSSGTSGTQAVDTSWITLETTAAQVSEKTGIPAKMLQQFLGINEADMSKPFSQLGGQDVVDKAASLVAQFGGGGMGGATGGTSGAPSGMGGTTSP